MLPPHGVWVTEATLNDQSKELHLHLLKGARNRSFKRMTFRQTQILQRADDMDNVSVSSLTNTFATTRAGSG